MKYYVLNNDNSVRASDRIEWALWFEHANRIVDMTHITSKVTVSTVFLGSISYRSQFAWAAGAETRTAALNANDAKNPHGRPCRVRFGEQPPRGRLLV